jgi:hypothetical protein
MKDIKDLLKVITIEDGVAYVKTNARQADEASIKPAVVFNAKDMARRIEVRIRRCIARARAKLTEGKATCITTKSIFFEDHTAYNLPSMNCMTTLYERLVNFGDKEFSGMDLVANFDTQELEQLLKAYVEYAHGWDHRASALCVALCESIYARCSCA